MEIGVLGHRVQSHAVEVHSLEIEIGHVLTRNRNMAGVNVLVVHRKLLLFLVTYHHVQSTENGLLMEVGALGHPAMSHAVVERRLEVERGHVQIQFQSMAGINASGIEQKRLQILVVPYHVQLMEVGLRSEVGVLGHHVICHAVVEQSSETITGLAQTQNQNMADNRV